MDAYQTSEVLLSYIKMSNLNFSLVESPFGVTITLKKSFIKNQDGSLRRSGLNNHPSSFQQSFTSPHQLFQNQKPTMQPLHVRSDRSITFPELAKDQNYFSTTKKKTCH